MTYPKPERLVTWVIASRNTAELRQVQAACGLCPEDDLVDLLDDCGALFLGKVPTGNDTQARRA